jgi:ArsR family transcriptional regulator
VRWCPRFGSASRVVADGIDVGPIPTYRGGVVSSTDLETISLEQQVELFKALADPNRLEILSILARTVRCNCHLQDLLDLAPNLLSYHLRILREAGLIVGERRGRWIDYSIAPEAQSLVLAAVPALHGATSPDPDGTC